MSTLVPSMQRGLAALLAALLVSPALLAAQAVTQPALKAAFLYNFAKFAEWPTDPTPSSPLSLCVLDDSAVADALEQLVSDGAVNGRTMVNGRVVTVTRGKGNRALRTCHLLYLGDAEPGRTAAALDELKGAPVLTVSDGDEFARSGGMVGLIVEKGRMRFAINPDAAQRGGVRLSSRLLTLAKLVKDAGHGQP